MADTYWAEQERGRWDVYSKQRGWMAHADTEDDARLILAGLEALQAQQPAAAVPAEVMLDALDEACKNSEGRRVSWYGYTRDQRIDVMRRAMLAAAERAQGVSGE